MTGEEPFLVAAEQGTEYLREHMRFFDIDNDIVYWYHGINVKDQLEQKIFASEFGDDYHGIPAYEQIYALAGPVQTYRINGDPRILKDARLTVKLFHEFFRLIQGKRHGLKERKPKPLQLIVYHQHEVSLTLWDVNTVGYIVVVFHDKLKDRF
jgi:hypothetical protein